MVVPRPGALPTVVKILRSLRGVYLWFFPLRLWHRTPPVSGGPHATDTRMKKKPVVWPVRSTGMLGAAQNWRWVRLKHRIHCDNSQRMFDGLTHQHAVKRVAMYRG